MSRLYVKDDAAERVEEEAAGRSVLQEWRAAPGSESCDFALLDKVGAWSLVGIQRIGAVCTQMHRILVTRVHHAVVDQS